MFKRGKKFGVCKNDSIYQWEWYYMYLKTINSLGISTDLFFSTVNEKQ